jgi:hypothetical protein
MCLSTLKLRYAACGPASRDVDSGEVERTDDITDLCGINVLMRWSGVVRRIDFCID